MSTCGRSRAVVSVFVAGMLAVAACGGDDAAGPEPTPTSPSVEATAAPPETEAPDIDRPTTTTTTMPAVTNGRDDVQITLEGARALIEMSGEGYTATYDSWSCVGIEGEWFIDGELVIEGYGTISGDGRFSFPPRPEEGSWDSAPFGYSMDGTLEMGDAVTEILYEFEDVVFTIIELEDGPTLGDSRGTAKATVKVTTPEMSMVVSETYAPIAIAPALIRSETHPLCNG